MQPKIIFDLSEVLIFGLVGVEKNLSAILHLPENEILKCFSGQLEEICRGEISEDEFLQQILSQQGWNIPLEILKRMSYPVNECWLIDDSPRNIEVATSVGINGIQFKNAKQLQEHLIHQSLW